MLSQWLDRGNNICDPFAKFAFYWLAFNGIYNENTDASGERDRVCKFLVELEGISVKRLLSKFKQGCKENLEYFAGRIPKDSAGNSCRREKGVLDLKTEKVYSIDEESLSHVESLSTDTTQCEELLKQIGGVLYTIRCNLFHGDKRPMEDDEDVVTHAIPILKAICETSEYR